MRRFLGIVAGIFLLILSIKVLWFLIKFLFCCFVVLLLLLAAIAI